MKVFYNAIIVHLILNIYVFVRGYKVLPDKKMVKNLYTGLFVIEFVLYMIGFIFNTTLPQDILKPILLMGTSWMILIGYTCALLLLYDFTKFMGKWINPIKRLNLQNLPQRRIAFIASFLIVLGAMAHGSYKFWHPTISEYNLAIDKKTNGLDKLRVAVVADIHAGYMIDKKVLSMYVDRIMEQKPDIILMVGDIIDYDLVPLKRENMDEEFRRLKAPYGVYASTGNHEYRLNAEEKIAWLSEKAGLTVLRDEAIKIADSFYLVGREDDQYTERKRLANIIEDTDKSYPIIVMNHEPKNLQEESDQNVDMAVYGHTHNGQLFPYNLVVNYYYEVGHGYKKKDNTHVYVTSGLGLSGPQYRIGTISEIAIFNLQFNN